MNKDISIRFGIKTLLTSKTYHYYLPLLAKELAFLIVWPERDTLRKNLPPCFTSFKNCCVIIDCTEIYIEGLVIQMQELKLGPITSTPIQ